MAVRAKAAAVGISPKKLKPVVDLVRGKRVQEALTLLRFLPSSAAAEVAKVVKSAMANAENNLLLDAENLKIVEIYANEGPQMKRSRPRARGRANKMIRRSSHITVVVDQGGS